MSLNNKFVWGMISGSDSVYVGHVITEGEKHTYCNIPVSELINRFYTHKVTEGVDSSLCIACQKENKSRLAEHYKIKRWVQ